MAGKFKKLNRRFMSFIEAQKLFFVATADREGRVNLSPKGLDTLRVLSDDRIAWLSLTGSGNETAAHLKHHDRITLMFCAFEGDALILRVYGHASRRLWSLRNRSRRIRIGLKWPACSQNLPVPARFSTSRSIWCSRPAAPACRSLTMWVSADLRNCCRSMRR